MKIKFITIILLLSVQIISAQDNYFPTGNVGIGTNAPTARLHVNNGDNSYGTILANASETSFSLYAKSLSTQPIYTESFRLGMKYDNIESNGFISFYRGASVNGGFLGFSTNGIERIRVSTNGNIGFGTNVPVSKLSINGSLTIDSGLTNVLLRPLVIPGTLDNGEIRAYSRTGDLADDGFLRLSAGGGTNLYIKSYIDLSGYSTIPDMDRNIVFGTSGTERMRINLNGNVGIGTINPINKLDVNGTIHSKEVKVDMVGWSDFVFKKEYRLPTLEQIEKHIAENGHLENIPNEEEVLKNGINLGEMNTKLLQKIEEMTLYMIEQNKQIKELKNENQNFKLVFERLAKIEGNLNQIISKN